MSESERLTLKRRELSYQAAVHEQKVITLHTKLHRASAHLVQYKNKWVQVLEQTTRHLDDLPVQCRSLFMQKAHERVKSVKANTTAQCQTIRQLSHELVNQRATLINSKATLKHVDEILYKKLQQSTLTKEAYEFEELKETSIASTSRADLASATPLEADTRINDIRVELGSALLPDAMPEPLCDTQIASIQSFLPELSQQAKQIETPLPREEREPHSQQRTHAHQIPDQNESLTNIQFNQTGERAALTATYRDVAGSEVLISVTRNCDNTLNVSLGADSETQRALCSRAQTLSKSLTHAGFGVSSLTVEDHKDRKYKQ